MEFRQWLFRSYKTDDDKLLEKDTVEQYDAAFNDLKAYLLKNEQINLTSISTADMKKILTRLDNDNVVKGLPNGEVMVRSLGLYIKFRERE